MFDITKEEVLNLAAQKLANQLADQEELDSLVQTEIRKRLDAAFAKNLNGRIDAILTDEVQKMLSIEVVPVDIWGERQGAPTTIRAAINERARVFWDTQVNKEGHASSGYGSKPRHQWLFEKIVNDEFAAVVKQNITNIIGALKDSLKVDAAKITADHIDKLIQVKTHND